MLDMQKYRERVALLISIGQYKDALKELMAEHETLEGWYRLALAESERRNKLIEQQDAELWRLRAEVKRLHERIERLCRGEV